MTWKMKRIFFNPKSTAKIVQFVSKTYQFCSTTQVPVLVPSSIILTAIGPWPWPIQKQNELSCRQITKLDFFFFKLPKDNEDSLLPKP